MPNPNMDSLSDLFAEIYHFNVGLAGLAYIGLGVGFLAATIFGAKTSDKMYLRVRVRFLPRSWTQPSLS